MKLATKNAAETQQIAVDLAKKMTKEKPGRNARVLALVGELGAGKTTFVQSFAKTLGIKSRMVSPTFLIFRSYPLRQSLRAKAKQSYKYLYHVDLYRIRSSKELNALNFKKIIKDPKNIVLIEWADKIKKILPKDAIWVKFSHGRKETDRTITY